MDSCGKEKAYSTEDDNMTLQREEIEALRSIYDDDFHLEEEDPPTFTVTIRLSNGQREASLMISFEPGYPKNAPPIYQLSIPWIRGDDKKSIHAELDELYLNHVGESIVYIWVERLREVLEERDGAGDDDKNNAVQDTLPSLPPLLHQAEKNPISDKLIASVSRLNCSDSRGNNQNTQNNSNFTTGLTTCLHSSSDPLGLSPTSGQHHYQDHHHHPHRHSEESFAASGSGYHQNPLNCKLLPAISTGEPFTDRKSTFQAHVAPIRDVTQVRLVLEELYKNKKIASATHNMYAYRIFKEDNSTWTQDCDDDGETHAGSRLLHLLQILECRNVLVVVTRWYGGIQLHADRFKHINNVARQLLETQGYLQKKPSAGKQ